MDLHVAHGDLEFGLAAAIWHEENLFTFYLICLLQAR
jgi:hypothetical protein